VTCLPSYTSPGTLDSVPAIDASSVVLPDLDGRGAMGTVILISVLLISTFMISTFQGYVKRGLPRG